MASARPPPPARPPSSRAAPRPTTSSTRIARFRPSVVDPWCAGDKFTVVVQLISNTLGLDRQPDQPRRRPCIPTIPVGRCTLNGWTQAELDRMNQMYSHSVG